MGLFDRIIDRTREDKLSGHDLEMGLQELATGGVTIAQLVSAWGLDATEEADLQWLIDQYTARNTDAKKINFLLAVQSTMYIASCNDEYGLYTTQQSIVDRITALP